MNSVMLVSLTGMQYLSHFFFHWDRSRYGMGTWARGKYKVNFQLYTYNWKDAFWDNDLNSFWSFSMRAFQYKATLYLFFYTYSLLWQDNIGLCINKSQTTYIFFKNWLPMSASLRIMHFDKYCFCSFCCLMLCFSLQFSKAKYYMV